MPFELLSAFGEYPAVDCCRSVPLACGTKGGNIAEFSSGTLLRCFDHYFIFSFSPCFF